jgi:UDP-glucose 4-epimerase
MKKVLVTGGLGFVGSNLVKILKNLEEYEITVIDNLCSKSSSKDYKEENVKYIIDDINNLDQIKYKDLNFDLIFHLAGLSRIQPSFCDPISYFKTNTLGTVQICELAKRCGAKIIYAASSSAEAGPHLNPYAFTKWSGEEILKMYAKIYNMSTVSTRFFNVYGPRQPWEGTYATVIGIFERQYKANEPLTITGTGEQRRDFTHVYDISNGMICLSKDNHKGEIYNLGTSKNHSINELAKLFECETKYIPGRQGEAWITKADISKTKQFGYNPKENLENYIQQFLNNFNN